MTDDQSEKTRDGTDRTADTGGAVPPISRGLKTVFTVVTLVLLALGVLFGLQVRQDATEANRRDAALAVARERVLQLTTLSYREIDQQLKSLLDGSTGEFRRQFQGTLGTFAQVVRQGKIEATGKIAAAGLVRLEDKKARLLVAATATVKNANSKRAEPRRYRLAVDLQRVEDIWLVSGMEFVP